MEYSLEIVRLGADGLVAGRPTVQPAVSESEAITILCRAVELARSLSEPMRFSVHGPERQLLMTYVTEGSRPRSGVGLTPAAAH